MPRGRRTQPPPPLLVLAPANGQPAAAAEVPAWINMLERLCNGDQVLPRNETEAADLLKASAYRRAVIGVPEEVYVMGELKNPRQVYSDVLARDLLKAMARHNRIADGITEPMEHARIAELVRIAYPTLASVGPSPEPHPTSAHMPPDERAVRSG